MAEWWEEQGYDTEGEAERDGAKKPSIFSNANAQRDTYFKDVKTPQDYFELISSGSYSPNWTTIGELRWVEKKFNVNRETAIQYRKGNLPKEKKDEAPFPRLVISEASKTAGIFDETTGEVITEPKEKDVPSDVTGLKNLNATLSLINKQFNNYDSLDEYITERPQDIKRFVKDNKVEVEPEYEEIGYVLRIDDNGELEGFDEQTGNTFNPKNTNEITGNDYFEKPIVTENQTVVTKKKTDGTPTTKYIIVQGADGLYVKQADPNGTYTDANVQAEIDRLNAERSEAQGTTQTNPIVGSPGSTKMNQFNNIPEGAILVQSDEDRLYLMYTVPGAGTMYKGLPIRMFYEVKNNDLYKAGILTEGAPFEINYFLTEDEIDDFIVAGNTAELPGNDPNTGQAPHPFLSFVDNLTTQAQIAPWLLEKESISLLAEAALEGREVSDAEWRVTNWYQTHSEAERNWLRTYYADPATATALKNDYKIQVSRALQAAGVTGGFDSATGQEKAPPDALVSWIADKWVSGQWTESYASEQLALFADPFRSGVRDTDFTNYVTTAGVEGLERTAEKEDRVKQLYTQYLGPVFGSLTDAEVSERAGRLRNDPDYEAALIDQLKNNRLGLFPKYTNPELTYEDIVTPWRNLTTSVWGEAADETQSWWQDMVATNDFTTGTATLRNKGLEIGNNQVTIEATEALQRALGDGSTLQNLGANQ